LAFQAIGLPFQQPDPVHPRWHHNLQHKGIAETKVVMHLWIVAGILIENPFATAI